MDGIIPAKISAGLTFDRLAACIAWPAPDWSLSLLLRGPSTINLSATAESSQHRFRALASVTTAWAPGRYTYSIRATRGDDVVEVESGSVDITPDMANIAAGTDTRSHARRTLENINAVLEKRATQDQQRYAINNRELWRTPIPELLLLRDRYAAEVRREEAVSRGKSLFGAQVRVRF